MVGQVKGLLNGRPFLLKAHHRTLVLHIRNLRTALRMRRSSMIPLQEVLNYLQRSGLRVLLNLPWVGDLELAPNPRFLVRRFLN